MSAVTDNPGLFADLPRRRRSLLDPRWILLALLAHLALLTAPESWWQAAAPVPEERTVTVRLVTTAATATVDPAAEAPAIRETTAEPRPEDAPTPQAEAATQAQMAPTETPIEAAEPMAPVPGGTEVVTTARPAAALEVERLLEAVAAMDWSAPDAARAPSRDTTSDVLERLRAPVLRDAGENAGNRFDGMHAPAEVEIMDRWLDAGGMHQVVIRAPDGETYCGRQEPVNDLRPWLQMPMLFHKCAGGGKRRPGASWRNN